MGLSSCFHHHDVSVSISDDEDEMKASYQRKQTHTVRVFVDEHLVANSMVSVKKGSKDKQITLNNKSKFYVNAGPREIRIHIHDRKNAEELRGLIKDIREELDEILEDN